MTEKKENVQLDKNIDPKEREKLESVRKADAAVKTMQDFTSPEVLYQELIASVRKYHPSTDISMIQKEIRGTIYHSPALRGYYSCRSGAG